VAVKPAPQVVIPAFNLHSLENSQADGAGGGRKRNKIGRLGEEFVSSMLKGEYSPQNVKWVNEHHEYGLPYDMTLSFGGELVKYIEVKSTVKKRNCSLPLPHHRPHGGPTQFKSVLEATEALQRDESTESAGLLQLLQPSSDGHASGYRRLQGEQRSVGRWQSAQLGRSRHGWRRKSVGRWVCWRVRSGASSHDLWHRRV
jgi:hypothetical protein